MQDITRTCGRRALRASADGRREHDDRRWRAWQQALRLGHEDHGDTYRSNIPRLLLHCRTGQGVGVLAAETYLATAACKARIGFQTRISEGTRSSATDRWMATHPRGGCGILLAEFDSPYQLHHCDSQATPSPSPSIFTAGQFFRK